MFVWLTGCTSRRGLTQLCRRSELAPGRRPRSAGPQATGTLRPVSSAQISQPWGPALQEEPLDHKSALQPGATCRAALPETQQPCQILVRSIHASDGLILVYSQFKVSYSDGDQLTRDRVCSHCQYVGKCKPHAMVTLEVSQFMSQHSLAKHTNLHTMSYY
jgi:hypothetical protein